MANRSAGCACQGGNRAAGAPLGARQSQGRLRLRRDVKPADEGVSELRIHYGPGYRVYHLRRGKFLVILLCGGDKSTQAKDIVWALLLAKEV